MPGKLYDYMATELPILVLAESSAVPELSRYARRLCVVSNRRATISAWIRDTSSISIDYSEVKASTFSLELETFLCSLALPANARPPRFP